MRRPFPAELFAVRRGLRFSQAAALGFLGQSVLQRALLAVDGGRSQILAGRLAGRAAQPGVAGAQAGVVARQRIRFGGQGLRLRIAALLEGGLPQIVPDGGVARFDAQRAFEGGGGFGRLAGVEVLGRLCQ